MICYKKFESMADLKSLITSDTNLVEIYFSQFTSNDNIINISIQDENIKKIEKLYGNFKTTNHKSYCIDNLTYVYDLDDDSQYVYTKILQNYVKNKKTHVYTFKYSKLPTHLFPCINVVDDIIEYNIREYKITNRISLIIRSDPFGKFVYIQFKYSENVEFDKAFSTLNNVIDNISKYI